MSRRREKKNLTLIDSSMYSFWGMAGLVLGSLDRSLYLSRVRL